MNAAFIDAGDRTWDLAIDDDGADRIKYSTGLDLRSMRDRPVTADDLATIQHLIGSEKRVKVAIAALLEPQLGVHDLTTASYHAALDKSAEIRALIAFTRALEAYLPGPPLDESLKKLRKYVGGG